MKMRFNRQVNRLYLDYHQEISRELQPKTKIQLTSWRGSLLLLIICSPLIFFLVKFSQHLLIMRTPGYIALPQIEIRANEDGYIGKILIKPGQRVKEGEQLCQLEQPELKKKENLLQSELEYLRHNPIRKNKKNNDSSKQANLALAIKQKDYMKKRLDEITQLFNHGKANEAEIKFAKFQHDEATARLADLESSVSRAQDTARIMQSTEENQEAFRIKELTLEKKKLDLQLQALAIFSPIQGSIADILVIESNYVSRGDLLFTITKHEKARINVYLPIDDLKHAQLEQLVTVAFTDNERTPAKVVKIVKKTNDHQENNLLLSGNKNNEVKIQLELLQPIKQKLLNGMPVEVFF